MPNKRLNSHIFPIPIEVVNYLKKLLKHIPNDSKSLGYNSIVNLIKKSDVGDSIGYFDLMNWNKRFQGVVRGSPDYIKLGGDMVHRWVTNTLNTVRSVDAKNVNIRRGVGLSEGIDDELRALLDLYL